jgi:hypothetical protein
MIQRFTTDKKNFLPNFFNKYFVEFTEWQQNDL